MSEPTSTAGSGLRARLLPFPALPGWRARASGSWLSRRFAFPSPRELDACRTAALAAARASGLEVALFRISLCLEVVLAVPPEGPGEAHQALARELAFLVAGFGGRPS